MAKKSRKQKIEDILWKFRGNEITVDQAVKKIEVVMNSQPSNPPPPKP